MAFNQTGNTCALLLVASAFGMVQQQVWQKCKKDGKVYVERVPECEWGFEYLTKREDMVVSQDGYALLAAALPYSSILLRTSHTSAYL